MDSVIEQMTQAKDVPRYDVFRRWASYLRDVVQPQLDELARLKAEASPAATKPRKGQAA